MQLPVPREALAAAGHRFSQANATRIDLAQFDEIMNHRLTRCDPDELSAAIQESITGDEADSAYRQSAYFALGKKIDNGLLDFFHERLRIELAADEIEACYQIMVALNDLDEVIFAPEREGGAVHEQEMNRRDAGAYLDTLGRQA
ncbi:MAG: hypothetical protein ACI9UA_003646 [Pseudoalteromonas tetraodonis]|jgi:hypothetical protein